MYCCTWCSTAARGKSVSIGYLQVALTVLYVALTVLYVALTVLYMALTVLYVALTVLCVALTVLYVALTVLQLHVLLHVVLHRRPREVRQHRAPAVKNNYLAEM